MKLISARWIRGLHGMEIFFNRIVLLFGIFSMVGFSWLLLRRCTLWKEFKCYVPELLQADQVYVFVACR